MDALFQTVVGRTNQIQIGSTKKGIVALDCLKRSSLTSPSSMISECSGNGATRRTTEAAPPHVGFLLTYPLSSPCIGLQFLMRTEWL